MASIETWMDQELRILKNTITDEKEMTFFNHTESCIRELMAEFISQGHSGFSASYCINMIRRIFREYDMERVQRVLNELPKDTDGDENDKAMQSLMNDGIRNLTRIICKHCNTSEEFEYLFPKVICAMDWKPLAPLTGKDDEWNYESDGKLAHNKRCFAVFKAEDGIAKYLHGYVFSDNGGVSWFTNQDSRIPVTFPFEVPMDPIHVYIRYTNEDETEWEEVTDPEEIKKIKKDYLEKRDHS